MRAIRNEVKPEIQTWFHTTWNPVTVSLIFHNLELEIKMCNMSVNPAKGPDALLHIKERACDTIIALGPEILFIN